MDATHLQPAINFIVENKGGVAAAVLGGIAYATVQYIRSPWRKLPPGPRGIPILGNIAELGDKQWFKFEELAKQYGDLFYLNAAGQPIIVVNDHKVAADLLDRRATIYSDRPQNIVASDIMTGGLLVVFTRYNDTWRRMRKAAHEGLNKGVVHKYHHTQHVEALLLARATLALPNDWDAHLRRASASAIMSMVYNVPPITKHGDPAVTNINDFVARLTRAAYPGAYLVEFFPWMRHFPSWLAKWKKTAEDWYAMDSAMFEGLFKDVKGRLVSGDHRASLASTLVNEAARHGLSDRENAWLAGTMYAAGSETTSGVMAWWMLALLAFPETQKRAQAEIDEIVGRSRPPRFSDLQSMPYMRAMVKEALRWRPVDPVGLPHRSTEDDWYDGKFIPKGSIVIANVWHLNRDPGTFGADAHLFNPARHLDANGQIAPGPADMKEEGHCTFGFGRRICVGRHVANNSLFIEMAMLLWAMNFERETGPDGKPTFLDVDGFIEDGLVVRPMPFNVKITPRFPEAAAILAQEQEFVSSE